MVQESGEGWKTLDTVWLSNGDEDLKARVEIRLELCEAQTEAEEK